LEESNKGKLNLLELVSLVVGSIIGGGVFNLMHDMAAGAGAGAIMIGWVITAIGMLTLAKTFQNLTMKRPTWMPVFTVTPKPASESTWALTPLGVTGCQLGWETLGMPLC
jgi:Amino acid transporters